MTPECQYNKNTFPSGYPMNWYPDMLDFLRKTVIQKQPIQMYKTIECITANCTLPNATCRVSQVGKNPPAAKSLNPKIPLSILFEIALSDGEVKGNTVAFAV